MPLVTSNTYNFQTLENDELILECFERIGISGEQLVPVKLNSARRSLNLLLLDWISKSTNLWTLNIGYLTLNAGQSRYLMDSTITDILQVNSRTFTRQLNGTADASEEAGNAANVFNGVPGASCNTGINGNISYDYGLNVTQVINFIGIKSYRTTPYSIQFEYLDANNDWLEDDPLLVITQTFVAGVTVWFDVPMPIAARAYRLREVTVDDAVEFVVQEIYFTNNIVDLKLSPVSRDTYLSFSQKTIQGRPSCYYFDKQIKPALNIWYTASNIYKVLEYSYIKVMQDVGGYYNITDVPARMYPALIWGLTWMLAIKYSPQLAADMKNEYEQAFSIATANDSENIDLSINFDIGKYYEN